VTYPGPTPGRPFPIWLPSRRPAASLLWPHSFEDKIIELYSEFSKRTKKGKLHDSAVQVLMTWWQDHIDSPYPTVSARWASAATQVRLALPHWSHSIGWCACAGAWKVTFTWSPAQASGGSGRGQCGSRKRHSGQIAAHLRCDGLEQFVHVNKHHQIDQEAPLSTDDTGSLCHCLQEAAKRQLLAAAAPHLDAKQLNNWFINQRKRHLPGGSRTPRC